MFKPYAGTKTATIDFGVKWSGRLMYSSIVVSMLIAILFSEDTLQNNMFFSGLVHVVGAIVPGISRATSVSQFPGLTSVVYALNWFCVPFYFAFSAMAMPFWNEEVTDTFIGKSKSKNQFVVWIVWPMLLLMWICLDVGLFPIGGPMTLVKPEFFFGFGLVRALVLHPITAPIAYWGMCVADVLIWYLAIFNFAVGTKVILGKLHIILHPVKSH